MTVRLASALATLAAGFLATQEPPPRRLGPPVARFDGDLSAISGVRELADGRILVSDFATPALHIIDLRTGSSTKIGRAGQGPNEFTQPGGIYQGRGDTALVLDRAQYRVVLVTRDGRIAGTRAIGVRGSSGSSSLDADKQRLDASGTGYFVDQGAMFRRTREGRIADSVALWRFDADRQHADTVVMLRQSEQRILSAEGNVIRTQQVLFSPADGWGVTHDGRVVAVRAAPYRIDWIGRDGSVARGPVTSYVPVRVTEEDRKPVTSQRESSGVGMSGSAPRSFPNSTPLFAESKPPFSPDDIMVAPDGHVWVGRYLPANAPRVVYDVFDGRGVRMDRIELPARSRVIGFGANAVYVNERDNDDLPHLRKYTLAR